MGCHFLLQGKGEDTDKGEGSRQSVWFALRNGFEPREVMVSRGLLAKSSLQYHFPISTSHYRILSGLIIAEHIKGFQFIISFALLNNPEVRKDYYHHFKMRKYQLREVVTCPNFHS